MEQPKYRLSGWVCQHGVTIEQIEGSPECFVLGLKGGWVTVDLERRIFGLGAAKPRAWGGEHFSGVGWKFRMCDAALEHLRSALGEVQSSGA